MPHRQIRLLKFNLIIVVEYLELFNSNLIKKIA
jgi:hypothetical protein